MSEEYLARKLGFDLVRDHRGGCDLDNDCGVRHGEKENWRTTKDLSSAFRVGSYLFAFRIFLSDGSVHWILLRLRVKVGDD